LGVKRVPRRKEKIETAHGTINVDVSPGTKWFNIIYKGNDGTIQTMAKIRNYDNTMLFANLKAETIKEIWVR
jgi:hypothetical protein